MKTKVMAEDKIILPELSKLKNKPNIQQMYLTNIHDILQKSYDTKNP